ncbi:MAG TPA: DUF4252 domain-containing protein [Steroidobacteraceae bacterium]|nr:DUF4252 domain-containing protein [Steroidobacteraceae bacterium]
MNKNRAALALGCLLLPAWAAAQGAKLNLPDFSSLAEKATESVNISLNPWLLHMAASFIDEKDPESAATRKMLAGIQSVEVRSFEFGSDSAYSTADIEGVRRQLTGPGWSQLMQVHDRQHNENVDVYVLIDHDRTKGFALIASEPRQFTIINIVGSISLEDLPMLEKRLNLPNVSARAVEESAGGPVSAARQ